MSYENSPTVSLDPDNPVDSGKVGIASNDGVPYDGQGAGLFGRGSVVIDRTTGTLYSNTGTLDAPVWTAMGGGGLDLPPATESYTYVAGDLTDENAEWYGAGVSVAFFEFTVAEDGTFVLLPPTKGSGGWGLFDLVEAYVWPADAYPTLTVDNTLGADALAFADVFGELESYSGQFSLAAGDYVLAVSAWLDATGYEFDAAPMLASVGQDYLPEGTLVVREGDALRAFTGNRIKGSIAFGEVNSAPGDSGAHAEGKNTTASGASSHAEGVLTVASGPAAHAEGVDTDASGGISHAEGSETTASGVYSHAEGRQTLASGGFAHAEGFQTEAVGDMSHVEGYVGQAEGQATSAHGFDAFDGGAKGQAQYVRAGSMRLGNGNFTPFGATMRSGTWKFLIEVSGVREGSDVAAGYSLKGVVTKNGTDAPRLVGAVTKEVFEDAGASGWDCDAVAHANGIQVQCTGDSDTRWVATAHMTEVRR